eukprot:542990-Prymnesium_polylepis.1
MRDDELSGVAAQIVEDFDCDSEASARRADEYSLMVSDQRQSASDAETCGDARNSTASTSGRTRSLAARPVRPEYQLEKWAAPLALPAAVANQYHRAYMQAREEAKIPEDMSFMHFMFLQALRKEDVADLMTRNPSRFSAIFRNGAAPARTPTTVAYLTSQKRRDVYEVHIEDGSLWTHPVSRHASNRFSTANMRTEWKVTGSGYAIFVWREPTEDDKGGLYAADHKRDEFHHSSFYAGAVVDCAGELKVDIPADGSTIEKLLEINNKSGHYKPEERQMLAFLTFLHRMDIELKGVAFRF